MISSWCLAMRIWADYMNGRGIADPRCIEATVAQQVMAVARTRTSDFDDYATSDLKVSE